MMLLRIYVLFLLFCLPFLSRAQEVTNIVSGYIPENDKLEVLFDFDAPSPAQTYRYKLYLQSNQNRRSIEIKPEWVQGIDLLSITSGIQKYFLVDLSKVQVPAGDYSVVFVHLDASVKQEVKLVAEVVKKDTTKSKPTFIKSLMANESKEAKESKVTINDDHYQNYVTIGINPIDISGKQTSKTVSFQYGRLRGNYGLALTFKYGIGAGVSTTYQTDNTLITNYSSASTYYKFNGAFKTDRLVIIPSLLLLITDKIMINVGAGYGQRGLYWGVDEISFANNSIITNWAKNVEASQSGVELQGGFSYLMNKFNFHVGFNHLGLIKVNGKGTFSELMVGLGYNF